MSQENPAGSIPGLFGLAPTKEFGRRQITLERAILLRIPPNKEN